MNVATVDGHKERFIKLLHELFQLDKPELDFGLYRIMHAKSDQLSRFIREDLAQAIEEAFAEQGEQQLAAMRQEIEEKRRQAEELGAPDPDSAPAVKQARAAYDVAKREQKASVDIYDHLYRFFSRYYDKGDFMSRRHHVAENDSRAAPYAVPYDGREVYLHWANKDQYYVKSSETLANFTFNLNEALKKLQGSAAQAGLGFDSVDAALKVHCRVVDATEGEHNDVKESTERFFIIHHDEPVCLEGADLVLQFEYRPDPEKTGQSGTWQKKRLEEAEEVIMAALRLTDGVAAFREGLATRAPTEKQKERTLLGKYLQQYTARNTMDYFIHKDLGGFLSRELDFYIKNEILRLDDIDNAEVLIVEQQLKKIQVLRKIAKQIITFLEQLESFQKKLWLKKKFVTGVSYCISLDFFGKERSLLLTALRNEAQRREWQDSFGIDIRAMDSDFDEMDLEVFLGVERYRYLQVDTSFFSEEFKGEVVSLIEDVESKQSGSVFSSDNFQALMLSQRKLSGAVDCVYIDPPYNTGEDGFNYKDGYRSSSWLSMMESRVSLCKAHLSNEGAFFSSIDDNEQSSLHRVLSDCFGSENHLGNFVWKRRSASGMSSKPFSLDHEYVLSFAKDIDNVTLVGVKRDEADYPHFDPASGRKYSSTDLTIGATKEQRPNQFYSIENPRTGVVYEANPSRVWRFFPETMQRVIKEGLVIWPDEEDGNLSRPRYKTYFDPDDNKVKPLSSWVESTSLSTGDVEKEKAEYEISILQSGMNSEGGRVLERMLGSKRYSYPKPVSLVSSFLRSSVSYKDGLCLDFFAGSGTTGHAIVDLNRQDDGSRKFFLVEMGEYFDYILKPRIKKASYSAGWKNGVPQKGGNGKLSGISCLVKFVTLESYDDTLNNLELDDNPQRDALMEQNPELRRDYTLKYLLDVETRGSASLLNTEWFCDPEGYTLKVKQPGSDETRETNVDLVETFNWLIGLHVTHLDKPRTYIARFKREEDPELPEDQNTRLKAEGLRENEDGAYWIRQVEGHVRRIPGSDEDLAKVLVVWRKLTDDPEKDAAVLEALLEKYKIGTTDSEFDAIYINGPHGLNLTGSARNRVHSLEETFHARMWEGCDDEL
ncbi:site-specific DNA-methyltransferase [Halomonas alimentaria]|uniref:site-specific DNA-methyltransferase n=1 Tax=Halomonas alimentaria TaxID=147248 RepID=UPI0024931CE7|nr:site-specific DNA-methyltransferase [Halomonas alimentaria]